MFGVRYVFAIFTHLVLANAYAAVDPVAWSLAPTTGFNFVNNGEPTSVVYTLTVNPKFPGPVVLHTQFKKIGGAFTIKDGCNNLSLKPGSDCQVTIQYIPADASSSSIQMSYQYNNNVIPLPILQVKGTGIITDVTGSISGLPSAIYLSNPPINFEVTYTNNGSDVTGYAGDSTGNNVLSVDPSSKAMVSVVPGQNFCGTKSSPILLRSGHSCTLQGQLTPVAAGGISVSGIFAYNNATMTANVNSTSTIINGNSCLSGEASLPFHSPTYQYADNVLQFTFTNRCSNPVILGNVSYSSSNTSVSPIITPAIGSNTTPFDHCSGQTLAASGYCTALVSVVPQAAGALSITATVSPNGTATASTTVNQPDYNHTITFVNQCPFPVWYGVAEPGDPNTNPSPNTYLLAAQARNTQPKSKSITISGTYNGQFFPRTGCGSSGNNFVCATGDCGSGANGQCSNSGNVYEPYTRIEETFTATSQGGYDVSLINGASIPAELKGLGPFVAPGPLRASAHSPLICTGAGAIIQPLFTPFSPQYPSPPPPLPVLPPPPTPLGYCPWTFTAPSPSSYLYNFVTNNGSISDCTSCTDTCGLAFQTTPSAGNLVLSCGELIGYWTINQLCSNNNPYVGLNPAVNNPQLVFKCTDPISTYSTQSYPSGTTVADLYSCAPQGTSALGSCYNPGSFANSTCCGAVDWNNSISYVTWQSSQSYIQNPDWLNGGTGGNPRLSPTPLASIQWLKDACPTAYSYPFDDHSGTFNCDFSDAEQQNHVNMDFEIVFCPGGVIGALNPDP